MKVRITNIQRFSLHDGPGIRTTVFLKGCMLRCPWCSNPENIDYKIQEFKTENRKGVYGYDIELDDLYDELIKDINYYKLNNGGVTFSGGEALLQFHNLEPLLKKLKKEKINLCIESSLYAPTENLEIALKYIDEFIIDLKNLDKNICKEVLKGDIDLYYKNIDYLFKNKNKREVVLRIPITTEYTFSKDNLKNLDLFLQKYRFDRIEIFKIHKLGEKKYKSLGLEFKELKDVEDKDLNKIYNMLKKYCNSVVINKI